MLNTKGDCDWVAALELWLPV